MFQKLGYRVVRESGHLIMSNGSSRLVIPRHDPINAITMGAILEACQSVPEAGVVSWGDISRVDIRPSRGMMKVLVKNNWEVQIDFQTGQVLQVAYRRSDLIESFHDGSWFGDWAKMGLFLPAGLILLVLWVTGLVLFVQPYQRKGQRGRDLAKG